MDGTRRIEITIFLGSCAWLGWDSCKLRCGCCIQYSGNYLQEFEIRLLVSAKLAMKYGWRDEKERVSGVSYQ